MTRNDKGDIRLGPTVYLISMKLCRIASTRSHSAGVRESCIAGKVTALYIVVSPSCTYTRGGLSQVEDIFLP